MVDFYFNVAVGKILVAVRNIVVAVTNILVAVSRILVVLVFVIFGNVLQESICVLAGKGRQNNTSNFVKLKH